MSGASVINSRPLGPTEAPSVQDTGIDLNNESLNPLEERASTAVRHQGDAAWSADQVIVPTEEVRHTESVVTSAGAEAREMSTITSDFQGINEVGEQEYQRILASMRRGGASDPEAYAVAAETRNRVTSVGGTKIESAREALQKEQAAEPLADIDAEAQKDGLRDGIAATEAERDSLTEAAGVAEDESIQGQLEETDTSIEGDRLGSGLDNGNALDLKLEEQLRVVESLKNERVRELTTAAGLDAGVENGLEDPIDPELAQEVEVQFEAIRDLVNQRQALLLREEPLSEIQREQLALGPSEGEALTF